MSFNYIGGEVTIQTQHGANLPLNDVESYLREMYRVAKLLKTDVRTSIQEMSVVITHEYCNVETQLERVIDFLTPDIIKEDDESIHVSFGAGWIPKHIAKMQEYSSETGKTIIAILNDVEVHANADDDYEELFQEFNKQMSIEGLTVAKL